MTTQAMERRAKPREVKLETRADGAKVLSGYAAVFYQPGNPDTEYELRDGCTERVAPGAFNRCLAERSDCICAFNHENDAVLGRTVSGTLRLSVDATGLRYECDLPKTTTGADVAEMVGRGDIAGSSFAFSSRAVRWETEADGKELRILEDVDLYDVGPVTWPAYRATTTGVRSAGNVEAERDEYRARRQAEADAVDVRAKMARL